MRLLSLSTIVISALMIPALAQAEFTDAERESITFSSGREQFPGYVYKPEGSGPFPVVVWFHGHADGFAKNNPTEYNELAKLYTREGFVLFIPDRHVRSISNAEYSPELQKLITTDPEAAKAGENAEAWSINQRDVTAAVEWIKQQSYIDPARLTLSGWSTGAALALFYAEEHHDLRSMVLFSPGVQQWKNSKPFQSKLITAMQKCNLPVFLVGAKDDSVQESNQVLGSELKKRSNCKVEEYFHLGADGKQKTSLAINGSDTWGYDVVRFVETTMKN